MKFNKYDIATITLISIFFLLISSLNLGSSNTPTTYWMIEDKVLYLQFESIVDIKSLYFLVSCDDNVTASIHIPKDGGWAVLTYLNGGGYYKWVKVDADAITDQIRIRFYFGRELYEIIAINKNGERIPIKDIRGELSTPTEIKYLFDEQQKFEYPPTYLTETYFDEVYFARAANDFLNLREPYEWTHPPLGKLIIATGIHLVSFTPLGWRILGVLFATLMIPVAYFLGYSIFKSKVAALLSSVAIFTDFMHFTMARIGTVDTYLVFFTMLSTLFFYINFEGMIKGAGFNFKYIILGVVSFYLAFSVKWTAAFNLLGNIILILIASFINSLRSLDEFIVKLKLLIRPLSLFFTILFLGSSIYLATYIPYTSIGYNFGDVYDSQWKMFFFHADLEGKHPFSSPWYTWPLILRPMKFYARFEQNTISSISAMGNPFIWWFGLCSIILSIITGIRERKWPLIFIGVLFITQLLPYALISRELFIYHYYPQVPILAIAIAGLLTEFWSESKDRKYVLLFLFLTIAAFIFFYPVISGYPIPSWYQEYMKWFRGWDF